MKFSIVPGALSPKMAALIANGTITFKVHHWLPEVRFNRQRANSIGSECSIVLLLLGVAQRERQRVKE